MMHKYVSIIILNWNGWKDTIECLESLFRINYPNYNVIVVDNGSEDESIEKIKEYCEGKIEVKSNFFEYTKRNKPIKIIEYSREEAEFGKNKNGNINELPSNKKIFLIKNEKNYGFTVGNNIAIKFVFKNLNPEYILLLNNDTVVDNNFLGGIVQIAEGDEKIGVVGPSIYHYYEKNKIQSLGAKIDFNTGKRKILNLEDFDEKNPAGPIEVDYVSGCALLAKSELIKKIGNLDPEYFAYCEEVEWCTRAKRIGYNVLCYPRCRIWHKKSKTAEKMKGFQIYHYTRNTFWFIKQYASKKQYFSFLLYFFGFWIWYKSFFHILYQRDIDGFTSFVRGIVDGIKKRSRKFYK